MLLFTHEAGLGHVMPQGHPEQVARLSRVHDVLADLTLDRRSAEPASPDAVMRCHPQTYLDALERAAPLRGLVALDADTHMSPGTLDAAWRGAGAAVQAVDAVLGGADATAFCAMRPPGHHAETAKPMGFCLLGNVAIAAKHAMDAHGLARVAVVDFDVHHGNGTQDLLWDEDRALFVSTHQSPLWPGTGMPGEDGAHGQVMNRTLDPNSGTREMRALYEREVLPRLDAFAPELVIVSAGFDAHVDDPLANLRWTDDDFAWITDRLVEVARDHADGRVVSCLEGGYDLAALGRSVRRHVDSLRGGA
ncbi:histone deacetylase family protein [Jannaschia sp. LMIT008]|uniref:histone deacetylase family protein n=1 Tax=Jannaschia maritima TaxID=3032585 RepID=UPI0028125FC2|nr:histone deacetylase family protein [Jannaschia sp. LMIT008]